MDLLQYNSCKKKIKYPTEPAAMAHLKSIAKKTGKIIPHTANAYKCIYCDRWHLGHKKIAFNKNYRRIEFNIKGRFYFKQ